MLIIHKSNLKEDGWTYGDWRQYVAFLPDQRAVCVRRSDLPPGLALLGMALALIVLFGAVFAWAMGIDVHGTAYVLLAVSFLMLAPMALEWLTGWTMCKTVGPFMVANKDGTYYRLFPGEHDDAANDQ